MSLNRLLGIGAILLLGSCDAYAEHAFAERCQRIAGIEVKNPQLWREYLRERKQRLEQTRVTVDGVRIDPTDLYPVTGTDNFHFTDDWELNGKPSSPTGEPYRDDFYVFRKSTGVPVARFRNVSLRIDTFVSPRRFDCIFNYPHLYTGSRPHHGDIVSF